MAAQTPPEPRRRMAVVDKTTLFYVLLALVSAALVWIIKSPAAMTDAVSGALLLFAAIAPMIVMGLFLGGLVKAIADPAKVAPILGQQSGLRGLALASILGALTPGGPFAAFPIVYAIFAAGADVGAVVAFLTGWSLIALHRVVVWELPLMGPDVVGLRILISLPLPVLAGLQARWLVRNVDLFRSVGPRDLSADEPRG
ncbi:MAG: permease [Pseudomonadota bacterium]